MKAFSELTAQGQARRLRRLALNALKSYTLQPTRVRLLAYHFNAIFKISAGNGRAYVLRVNLPGLRSLAEIRAEAAWLAALRAGTDLQVPTPIPNREEELVTTAVAEGVPEPRHCVLFEWMRGRDLKAAITREHYETLGRLTAQLHEHAGSWSPPDPGKLKVHDGVYLFGAEPRFWEMEINADLVSPARAAVFRATEVRAAEMLRALYRDNEPPRILHADLHQGNLRLFRGRMGILDFDDCLLGHPVQDIGITFYYIRSHPEFPALQEAYLRGYESVRTWPECEPGQIAGQVAARALVLAQFLSAGSNPQYRAALPGFLDRMEADLRAYLNTFS